jgi:hypothetical protein
LINFPKNPLFEEIDCYPCVYLQNQKFIYPNEKSLNPNEKSLTNLKLKIGDSIGIWCPMKWETVLEEWICVGDNFFYSEESLRYNVDYGFFISERWARGHEMAIEKPIQSCLNDINDRMIDIGFTVPTSDKKNIFLSLYSSCYNVRNARVNYVKFTVKPFKHQSIEHITFKNSALNGNVNVENYYNTNTQLATLTRILGSVKARRLVYRNTQTPKTNEIDFLARGK